MGRSRRLRPDPARSLFRPRSPARGPTVAASRLGGASSGTGASAADVRFRHGAHRCDKLDWNGSSHEPGAAERPRRRRLSAILDLEKLIHVKRAAGRPKDYEAIAE